MIPVWDIEQGSESWFQAKAGRPGASSFDRIITTKGEPSKSRKDYIYELAGEKLIGRQEAGYSNAHMQRGNEMEGESRALFELTTGLEVRQVGIVYRDESMRVLCSPDGLMESSGLEMKNPMLKTAVKYLMMNKLPTDYFCQVQGSMWVCGFETWWFMSNYPGLPPLILKVNRDEKWISKLSVLMNEFLDEMDNVYNEISRR
jgi:hypothetical protein